MQINTIKKTLKEDFQFNIFDILFIVLTFILLFYRLTIHADIFDEIINLSVSYRVALGQLPFYECWEAFQSGDLLLSPFLWLYIGIFGKTGGIVLASRFFYLLVLSGLGIFTYFTFRNILTKKTSFYIGYLCVFFEIHSLFYLWYDTIAIIAVVFGCLFLYKSFLLNNKKSYIFLSGLSWGIASFSYPSFLLAAILVFCLLAVILIKAHRGLNSLFYILGGFSILGAFLLYAVSVIGLEHFIQGIKIILSYRTVGGSGEKSYLCDIIISFIRVNKALIIPSALIFIIFIKSIKEKKYIKYFVFAIPLCAFLNIFFVEGNNRGLNNIIGYISIFAPFFYYLINDKNKNDFYALLFLWLPAILTSLSISLTTVYAAEGPVKCWEAFLPGAFVSIIFMYKLIKENEQYFPKKRLQINIVAFLIFALLCNSYFYVYLGQPYIAVNDNRMEHGIYRGIKVNSDMENMVTLQRLVDIYSTNCNSVLAGANLRSVYLMSDMLPCTPSVESPYYYDEDGNIHWDMVFKYFNVVNKYPDVIFIEDFATNSNDIQRFLNKHYTLSNHLSWGSFSLMIYVNKSVQ